MTVYYEIKTEGQAVSRKRIRETAVGQTELLDVASKLRTAACVPALREAVKAWKAGGPRGGYKGVTDTTRILLNHWFHTDHKLATGVKFEYHRSQQEAIETLIFVWECEKARTRKRLLELYAQDIRNVPLPPQDDFARYCVKMATGSGKTKVMALAVVWQFLNAMRESDEIAKEYAKTFLVLAPNVIVFERLKADFGSGRIFRSDPLIPKELEIFWDFDCVMRGEAEKAFAEGTLFLTNIHQFLRQARQIEWRRAGRDDGGAGAKASTEKAGAVELPGADRAAGRETDGGQRRGASHAR